MSVVAGRCMCGAVKVTAELSRDDLNVCNCDMCRRWTGVAFMSVRVHQSSIHIEGPTRRFKSSDWAERGFCDTCGSTLWYRLTAPGPGQGAYNFSAGLFDTGDMKIGQEYFVDSKPQGWAFAGDHLKMTEAETMAMFAPKNEGKPQ